MLYDPSRHDRQSTRLRGFDYASPAAYFVTLCTCDRACLFGTVIGDAVGLNVFGRIVEQEWLRSEVMREEVVLDAYVVMPNHLHGIVLIVPPGTDPHDARDPCGYRVDPFGEQSRVAGLQGGAAQRGAALHRPPKSLGSIIAGFKAAATRRINRHRGTRGAKVWQYKYHDRIIRDEREWRNVRRYIAMNPARWNDDGHHPDAP